MRPFEEINPEEINPFDYDDSEAFTYPCPFDEVKMKKDIDKMTKKVFGEYSTRERKFVKHDDKWVYYPFGKDKKWQNGKINIEVNDNKLYLFWQLEQKNIARKDDNSTYESKETSSIIISLPDDSDWNSVKAKKTTEGYLCIEVNSTKNKNNSYQITIE